VIGPTLARSATGRVGATLLWFQHILLPSQVSPYCPRPLAENFENFAEKSSRRKSRHKRSPFHGSRGLLRDT
jgi:hypothetical protein